MPRTDRHEPTVLDGVCDVGWNWGGPRVFCVVGRTSGQALEFRLRWVGGIKLGRLSTVGSYVDARRQGGAWEYVGTLTNAEPARGWAFHVGKKATADDGLKDAARWFFDKVLGNREQDVLRQAEVTVRNEGQPRQPRMLPGAR